MRPWLVLACLLVVPASSPARADDAIPRIWQNLRTSAMGGVLLTTGLYDQNFYGNPARVTGNAFWRVATPLDATVETTIGSITSVGTLLGGGDILTNLAATAGTNVHARFQLAFPAVYIPATDHRRWALAIGALISVQTDLDLRRSYQLNLAAISNAGTALTFGYEFFKDRSLAIGTTLHPFQYRLSSSPSYTLIDMVAGRTPSISQIGGEGSMYDADIGFFWRSPWNIGAWNLYFAGAVNHLLGGQYSNIPLRLTGITTSLPVAQPRSYGAGVALKRSTLGPFRNTQVALEFTDIGNNGAGSLFRLIHIGAETWWRGIMPRVGFNQGYWSAGLGLDLNLLELELATYGEELSLNTNGFEDRRYAARIQFRF